MKRDETTILQNGLNERDLHYAESSGSKLRATFGALKESKDKSPSLSNSSRMERLLPTVQRRKRTSREARENQPSWVVPS